MILNVSWTKNGKNSTSVLCHNWLVIIEFWKILNLLKITTHCNRNVKLEYMFSVNLQTFSSFISLKSKKYRFLLSTNILLKYIRVG